MFHRTLALSIRAPLSFLSSSSLRSVSSAGAARPPADTNQRHVRPASETTGTEAKVDPSADKKSDMQQQAHEDGRHPAQQPDPQPQPSRSTGIGGQGEVSPKERAG